MQALSALLLLPALLSLDLQRRRAFSVDFFCCLSNRPENPLTLAGRPPTAPAGVHGVTPPRRRFRRCLRVLSPRWVIRCFLVPLLRRLPAKAIVVTAAAAAVGLSSFGLSRFTYGLDFASVLPRGSSEHAYVEAHQRYLGVYPFFVSTGNAFDYANANGQRLLRRYFEALRGISLVMTGAPKETKKSGEYQPPVFWLDSLRDWLQELQTAFRHDVKKGAINNTSGQWYPNASTKGLIGMLMMIHTGDDRGLDMTRLRTGHLVDRDGIIYPQAFYDYLTAWRSLRTIEYEAVRNLLRPQPRFTVIPVPRTGGAWDKYFLRSVARSAPLEFTQMNFYLRDVRDSATMLRVVKAVREVTDVFTAAGLETYPSGVPFIFFEQYFHLPRALALALAACLVAFLLSLLLFFFNLRAVFLALLCLVAALVELCGLCSALGFHLNGASGAVLLLCSGLFARQQVPLLWAFLIARGDRQTRASKALASHGAATLRAAVALFLAISLLSASQLDFIVTYFFHIISLAVAVGLLNALLLLPVLLAFVGPASQFRPGPGWAFSSVQALHPGLHPPSPPLGEPDGDAAMLQLGPSRNRHFIRPRPASLSTISEEPSRLSSSSSLDAVPPPPGPSVVFMEPEIVLRTSSGDSRCFAQGPPASACSSSSSSSSCSSSGGRNRQGRSVQQACCHDAGNQITTVKATAKFKVEVHSPLAAAPRTFETSHHKSSKRQCLPPPYQSQTPPPQPPQYSRAYAAPPKPQRYLFPDQDPSEPQ